MEGRVGGKYLSNLPLITSEKSERIPPSMDSSSHADNLPSPSVFNTSPPRRGASRETSPPPFSTTAHIQAFSDLATRSRAAEEAWQEVEALRRRCHDAIRRLEEIVQEEQQTLARAQHLTQEFWKEAPRARQE